MICRVWTESQNACNCFVLLISEQDLLFQEYIDYCHPTQNMNLNTFTSFMTLLKGARPETIPALFVLVTVKQCLLICMVLYWIYIIFGEYFLPFNMMNTQTSTTPSCSRPNAVQKIWVNSVPCRGRTFPHNVQNGFLLFPFVLVGK